MCTLAIPTGQELANAYMSEEIATWKVVTIDRDTSNNGANSIGGKSLAIFQDFTESCGLDLPNLSTEDCDKVTYSLRWYVIHEYLDNSIRMQGSQCSDEHLKKRDYACQQSVEFANMVSTCLGSKIKDKLCPSLPDIFDSILIDTESCL